ncbi:MAG: hypothetical protein OET44_12705 [Gammaproteobacteria bacterium]|nr:hypothetical protein [Gammaproteobacteria bacterium]
MAAEYKVIFAGELVAGADPDAVKANFQKLFKADAKRVDKLFSGNRVLIKKNVDEATAQKYQATLRKAGGVCSIEPMNEEQAVSASGPAPTPPIAPRKTPGPASTWQLEAPGADLRDPDTKRNVPPPPDTGDLTLANVGAQMLDEHVKPDPFEADLSDISMAPTGTELLPETPKPQPFEPDLSELSVAPAGSELLPGHKKEKPPPPDTGDLELES